VNIFKTEVNERQKNCTKVEDKWCETIEYNLVNQNIGLQNLSGNIEYTFILPGTNAAVEKTFSNINILWCDEKNRFLIVYRHYKSYR